MGYDHSNSAVPEAGKLLFAIKRHLVQGAAGQMV
jgi:hypothetical protein